MRGKAVTDDARAMRRRLKGLGVLVATVGVTLALAAPAGAFEVLDEIGEPGVGPGGLAAVQGIGIDGNGQLVAAQAGVNRVAVFDRNGQFVRAFGRDVIPGGGTGFEICTTATGCQAGSGGPAAGEFSTAWDAAPTAGGESVYVSDTGNQRASQFSSTSDFVRSWGYDVIPAGGTGFEICTAVTTCKQGIGGLGAGQLNNPFGIAVGPSGSVHVSDAVGIVHTYGADGAFVDQFGFPGNQAGQLSTPYGLTVDASGTFVVPEVGNNRISIFNSSGGFVRAFGYDVIPGGGTGFEICTIATDCKPGAGGPGAGQLIAPADAGVAPDGSFYVAELGNQRVSQFTPAGQFIRSFGYDVIPGGGAGFEICTGATTCKSGVAGNSPGQFATPWGVAVDCRGSVYVSEQGNQRIEKFGEPGTRLAPCPSNDIQIGKPKLNKKKGTAKLPVQIPGPGELLLGGAKVKPQAQAPTVAGEAILPVKAAGKAKKKLKKKGKVKVTADVTFTPVNGDPNTESAKVKLKRKK